MDSAEEADARGWRPSLGQEVPGRPGWTLEERLGEGGFGEAWLARHARTREERVFKFCFDPERLRSFKREEKLFILLKSALGERDDIATIFETRQHHQPYFIESRYYPEGNLLDWAEKQGGLASIPLTTRLDIVARLARTTALAHSIGIVHKDLKPSNVLIRLAEDGSPRPVLADFGIGALADRAVLDRLNLSAGGFSGSLLTAHSSSRTGTRLYTAPEYLTGHPPSILGDVYALGVILYQLTTGDPQHALAPGWENDIPDPLLRADIAEAVSGRLDHRLQSADTLAARLESLDQRRTEAARLQRLARRARFTRLATAIGSLAAVVIAILAWALAAQITAKKQAIQAKNSATQAQTEATQAARHAQSLLQEASRKAHGAARDAFEVRDDPSEGLAYLAEALKYDPSNSALQRDVLQRLAYLRNAHPVPLVLAVADSSSLVHISFSPDGTRIITASMSGTARMWEAATGKPVGEPLRHSEDVNSASFSPDGTRFVTASDDGTARIWEAATGKPVGEPLRHSKYVYRASFSPDGTRIVTASGDGTARIWEAATGKPVGEPLRHSADVNSASFSPDGTRVVTASEDNTARIWEAATGKQVGEPLRHEGWVDDASFSPDGTRLVTASGHGTVRIWETATGRPVGELLDEFVHIASFSPDGTRIFTASEGTGTAGEELTTRTWEAATGMPIGEPIRYDAVRFQGPDGTADYIASFSADGTRFVTASDDTSARIWKTATGTPLGEPLRHKGLFTASLSPDGTRILTAGYDGKARIWEAATGKPVGEPIHQADWVVRPSFSPDGTRIVAGGSHGMIMIWEVATGNLVGEPPHHEGVLAASFSPDGASVLSWSHDGTVRIWEAATGNPVGEPLRHSKYVYRASFSPDGTRIVTASGDDTARIWEYADLTHAGSPPESLQLSLLGLAGRKIDDHGRVRSHPTDQRMAWRDSILRSTDDNNVWHKVVRWHLSDPGRRTIAPLASLTMEELRDRELDWLIAHPKQLTYKSLAPLHFAAPSGPLLHLALALVETDPIRRDFLTAWAMQHLPEKASIGWWRRAAGLLAVREDKPLALERTIRRRMAAEHPDDLTPEERQHLGQLEYRQGAFSEAFALFEASLTVPNRPADARDRARAALAAARLGKSEQAAAWLESSRAMVSADHASGTTKNPDQAIESALLRGWTHLLLGVPPAALEEFRSAGEELGKTSPPDSLSFRRTLVQDHRRGQAVAHLLMGRPAEALESFAAAIAAEPVLATPAGVDFLLWSDREKQWWRDLVDLALLEESPPSLDTATARALEEGLAALRALGAQATYKKHNEFADSVAAAGRRTGRRGEALGLYRQWLERWQAVAASASPEEAPMARWQVSFFHNRMAELHESAGQWAAAAEAYQAAFDLRQAASAALPKSEELQFAISRSENYVQTARKRLEQSQSGRLNQPPGPFGHP